jgi:hypothetical protein
MKTYNFEGQEFQQKNFREAKYFKDYWIQRGKLLSLAIKHNDNVMGIVAEMVFDEKPIFEKFFACFMDGDFSKITELEEDVKNHQKLIIFAVEVLSDFFTVSNDLTPS